MSHGHPPDMATPLPSLIRNISKQGFGDENVYCTDISYLNFPMYLLLRSINCRSYMCVRKFVGNHSIPGHVTATLLVKSFMSKLVAI